MTNRRTDDVRIEKIESTVEDITKDVQLIKQKIFNGYDKSIKSTESKVNYIDEQNTRQHGELKDDIEKLSGKVEHVERSIEKLLWKLVGITFFAIIADAVLQLFGVLK